MNRKLRCLMILACFSVTITQSEVWAQPSFVVFSATFETFPHSDLNDPLPASPDLETRLGNLKMHIAYPLAGSPESGSFFIGKVFYERLDFNYNNNQLAYSPEDLQELGVELSWRKRLGNRWFLSLMAMPNLASDLENVDGDHINLDAGVVFNRRTGTTSGFGFGARYTTDFGEPLLLPVVMYKWTDRSSFKIDLLLPRHLEFMYLPGPSIEMGLAARVSGNHYRIGQQAILANNVSLANGRIKYSVITFGPAFRFGVTPNAFLTIEGGAALSRRFEVFDENDTEINSLDLERSFSFRAGFQLRR